MSATGKGSFAFRPESPIEFSLYESSGVAELPCIRHIYVNVRGFRSPLGFWSDAETSQVLRMCERAVPTANLHRVAGRVPELESKLAASKCLPVRRRNWCADDEYHYGR